MQYIFIQATKHHLFSASLSRYTQPNMTALHVLSLSYVSLALRYCYTNQTDPHCLIATSVSLKLAVAVLLRTASTDYWCMYV